MNGSRKASLQGKAQNGDLSHFLLLGLCLVWVQGPNVNPTRLGFLLAG